MFHVRFRPVVYLAPQNAYPYHRGNILMGVLNLTSIYIQVYCPAMNPLPDYECAHQPNRKLR
jgi:hypothetical protein